MIGGRIYDSYTLKNKAYKKGFQEPFLVTQRTFQWTVLKITFFLSVNNKIFLFWKCNNTILETIFTEIRQNIVYI